MNTKQPGRINLFEDGRDNWEKTNEFKRKVEEIKKNVADEYSLILLNETSWAKRLLIKIRVRIEIRKRIAILSSLKNLHAIYR